MPPPTVAKMPTTTTITTNNPTRGRKDGLLSHSDLSRIVDILAMDHLRAGEVHLSRQRQRTKTLLKPRRRERLARPSRKVRRQFPPKNQMTDPAVEELVASAAAVAVAVVVEDGVLEAVAGHLAAFIQ